jgi:hypothetical protein
MKRFSLIAIALLAFVAAPQSSFADYRCERHECDSRSWWVEIVGDGNCYVKFKEDSKANYSGKYVSPMAAYIAIARKPACYKTTEWLMQYEYIRRAVR